MNRTFQFFLVGLICFFTFSCSSKDPKLNVKPNLDEKISFISSSGKVTYFSLDDLNKRFPKSSLIVNANPGYHGARKEYEGFDLATILNAIEPTLLKNDETFWLKVTTQDGWTAPEYESKTLLKGKALLATSENSKTLTEPISEDGLWSILVTSKRKFYPGPFYLVWNDSGKNPDVLPLQVAKIMVMLSKPENKKN